MEYHVLLQNIDMDTARFCKGATFSMDSPSIFYLDSTLKQCKAGPLKRRISMRRWNPSHATHIRLARGSDSDQQGAMLIQDFAKPNGQIIIIWRG